MKVFIIKGEKIQTYMALCEKVIAPLLKHNLTMVYHT